MVRGLWLKPVSGPYDGSEYGYAFSWGQGDDEIVYRKVAIADETFRGRLETGASRFTAGDLIKVELEITQRVTESGELSATHRITRVIDYRPLKATRQQTFSEYLDG